MERYGASEQSERCELTNVASNQVARSKRYCLWLETPPELCTYLLCNSFKDFCNSMTLAETLRITSVSWWNDGWKCCWRLLSSNCRWKSNCDLSWRSNRGLTWHDMTWHDMTWHGKARQVRYLQSIDGGGLMHTAHFEQTRLLPEDFYQGVLIHTINLTLT